MLQTLTHKFQSLPAKERKQLLFLISAALLAGYFFWASHVWSELFDARKMADRRANRIETRIGEVKPPELKSEISDRRLKKLETQLAEKEEQLKRYIAKLLPLNDQASRENLKLEITRLAETEGLEIRNFISIKDAVRQKTPANELDGEKLRKALTDRPRFKLELSGGYFQLVGFLDGLNHLTYLTRVENIIINRANSKNTPQNQLNIHFELQM